MIHPEPPALPAALVANMGHTLRTPLNQVLGNAELLSEQISGPLTERQMAQANTIAEAGSELLRVVNDLTLLAQVAQGLRPEPGRGVALGELLRSASGSAGGQARWECVLDAPADALVGSDRHWCTQAVVALLESIHAVAAADDQIRVVVSGPATSNGAAGFHVEISVRPIERLATAPADVERLTLDAFASHAERIVYGAGVRLTLAHRLLVALGGDLDLGAHAGGLRVVAVLPAYTPGAARHLARTLP